MKEEQKSRKPKEDRKESPPHAESSGHGKGGERDPQGKEDFRARFLSNLEIRRAEVETALNRLKSVHSEYKGALSSEEYIEDVDRAEREISASTHYSLLERKTQELERIDILIRRVMREKDFGRCEECGKRIPEGRLLIVPEATLCVSCQREQEKYDSRRNMALRSYHSLGSEKGLEWEEEQNSDHEGDLVIESDVDDVSFPDFDPNEPKADLQRKDGAKASPLFREPIEDAEDEEDNID